MCRAPCPWCAWTSVGCVFHEKRPGSLIAGFRPDKRMRFEPDVDQMIWSSAFATSFHRSFDRVNLACFSRSHSLFTYYYHHYSHYHRHIDARPSNGIRRLTFAPTKCQNICSTLNSIRANAITFSHFRTMGCQFECRCRGLLRSDRIRQCINGRG